MNLCTVIQYYRRTISPESPWRFRFHRALPAFLFHVVHAGYYVGLGVSFVLLLQLVFPDSPSSFVHPLVIAVCLTIWAWQYREPEYADGEEVRIKVTRDEAPELFGLLDELHVRSKGRQFDEVWLSDELRACISLRKVRHRPFGKQRELTIGWRLIQLLPRDELMCLLAHELAHLQRSNLKTPTWVLKADLALSRIRHHILYKPVCFLLRLINIWLKAIMFFGNWYSEVLADQHAAEICGRNATRVTTARLGLAFDSLTETRPLIAGKLAANAKKQVDELPLWKEIDSLPFAKSADVAARLRQSHNRISESLATHPSCGERLKFLGVKDDDLEGLAMAVSQTSEDSRSLTAACEDSIRDQLIALRKKAEQAEWQHHFEQLQNSSSRRARDWQRRMDPPEGYFADLCWHAWCAFHSEGYDQYRFWLGRIGDAFPDSQVMQYFTARFDILYGDTEQRKAAIQRLEAFVDTDDQFLSGQSWMELTTHYAGLGDSANLNRIEQKWGRVQSAGVKRPWVRKRPLRKAELSQREKKLIRTVFERTPIKRLWMLDRQCHTSPSLTVRLAIVEFRVGCRRAPTYGIGYMLDRIFESNRAVRCECEALLGQEIRRLPAMLRIDEALVYSRDRCPQTSNRLNAGPLSSR